MRLATIRFGDGSTRAVRVEGETSFELGARDVGDLQTLQSTTPVGPYLATPEELPGGVPPQLPLTTVVDGETMQEHGTADLLFNPVALVQYVSTMVTLRPGGLLATGTPGGVGHAREPARHRHPGERVVTEIGGLGRLDNLVVADTGGVP